MMFGMNAISSVLPYIQMVLAVILTAAVLLQRNSTTLGGAFGGDNFSSAYHTRRGFERTLFIATIIIAILFTLSAIAALII